MIQQAAQLIGAFMILGAFAGLQFGRLRVADMRYLLLNLFGAGILLIVAIYGRQWGFILLEAVWTAVALIALARLWAKTSVTSAIK